MFPHLSPRNVLITLPILALLAAIAPAQGGKIQEYVTIVGGSFNSTAGTTDLQFNDNNTAPDQDVDSGDFDQSINAYFMVGIKVTDATTDIVWKVSNTGGLTEVAVDLEITNRTGHIWTGLKALLGFGTGDAFVTPTVDHLSFDTPHRNDTGWNSYRFLHFSTGLINPNIHDDHLMAWSVGVPAVDLNPHNVSPTIDFPDWSSAIPDWASIDTDQGYYLTLRLQPIFVLTGVPEPASAMVLGVLTLGLSARRRRR